MTSAAISQSHFRGRSDTATIDTAPTWIANEDTNWTQIIGSAFRVRFKLQETNGGNPAAATVKLQANKNGGTYQDVTTSSTIVKAADAGSSADEASIVTSRLTGTGTYIAGRYSEDGSTSNAVDLSANSNTEYEFGVQLESGSVNPGDVIRMKVVALSGTAITATTIPALTAKAQLSPPLIDEADSFPTPTVFALGVAPGNYSITVRAFDGALYGTKAVTVTVISGNSYFAPHYFPRRVFAPRFYG